MAFFWKADAKVRTIFELPKLFRSFFQKVFFEWKFETLSLFQYFNSSAFLSRKRVQNYCFTAYTPNFRNTFLLKICILSLNSLILKRCRKTYFITSIKHKHLSLYLIIIYYKETVSADTASLHINHLKTHQSNIINLSNQDFLYQSNYPVLSSIEPSKEHPTLYEDHL